MPVNELPKNQNIDGIEGATIILPERIETTDLIPGVIIEQIQNVDGAVEQIASNLRRRVLFHYRNAIDRTGMNLKEKGDTLEKRFRTFADAKKFFGKIGPFTIIILPTDQLRKHGYGNGERKVEKQAEDAITFLASGEMYSTAQKGIVGYLHRICTVEAAIHYHTNHIWIDFTSKPVRTSKSLDQIESLIEGSRARSLQAHLQSLHKIFSGGLPSLGKRS